jgi:hypothetical protein
MLLKNIFLLFNVFILLIFQALFEGGVTVTQNIPANANPGSDFIVEVTVNKGDIAGFAKYSQELPDGFSASVVDANGGNFSFSDKNVKIIWMSLPTNKEFKIKYKIAVGADVKGSFPITAKLSYLENNEKKTFDVPASTIAVGNTSDNQTAAAEPAKETKPSEQPVPAENPVAEMAKTSAPAQNPETTQSNSTGSVTANRKAPTASASNEFNVEITVKKGTISGFAKLEETIPAGYTATGIETNGSVFSFVDGKAKFLWMSIPNSDEFKVSYKLTGAADFKGECAIEGVFSYVENEETKKAIISKTSTNIGSADALAQNSNQTPTTENAKQEPTPAPVPAPKPSPAPKPVTTVSSPVASKGIVFRVQVCAVHKNVPNNYFNDLFKISDEVLSETHEGWFKYTTGNYSEYQAARNRRVNLADNGVNTGPFVTAYNNGNRITVQEALMVANQKWVK